MRRRKRYVTPEMVAAMSEKDQAKRFWRHDFPLMLLGTTLGALAGSLAVHLVLFALG